jgi:hypothetical protein
MTDAVAFAAVGVGSLDGFQEVVGSAGTRVIIRGNLVH